MASNRQYKDSVFREYFSNKVRLAEICRRCFGIEVDPEAITINTLDTAFFSMVRNDISFEVGGRLLVLFEHQASFDRTMPFRMLIYYAALLGLYYEKKILQGKKIPRPEFIVLYNGKTDLPSGDFMTMKFSDFYEENFAENAAEISGLELTVAIYDIRRGHNSDILTAGSGLWQYSEFVSDVEEFRANGKDLHSALLAAIEQCLSRGILVDFLTGREEEIAAMLIGEMTYEREMEIAEIKGEGRAEARGREEREILLKELARKDQEAARAEQEKEALQRQLDQLLKQQSR